MISIFERKKLAHGEDEYVLLGSFFYRCQVEGLITLAQAAGGYDLADTIHLSGGS